jgi:hypothetical protein
MKKSVIFEMHMFILLVQLNYKYKGGTDSSRRTVVPNAMKNQISKVLRREMKRTIFWIGFNSLLQM